jgi:hypothetical protein
MTLPGHRNWKQVSLLTFFALLAAGFFTPDYPAAGQEQKELKVSLSINVSWKDHDTQSGILETGSYTIQVNGTVKPLDMGHSRSIAPIFVPSGMSGNYTYKNRGVSKRPPARCPALQFEVSGSGSLQITSPMSGGGSSGSDNVTFFQFGVMTGDAAKLGWRGYIKDYPTTAKKLAQMTTAPANDFYHFMFAPVLMKFHGRRQKECGKYEDYDGKQFANLKILHGLTQEGMTASYSWQASRGHGEHLNILDWGGIKEFGPKEEGSGSHSHQVSWTIGDVKPIIRIRRLKKVEGNDIWVDITEQPDREPQKILVGQKVQLKAEVEPGSKPPDSGKWEINGEIVAGYDADIEHGKVKKVEDEQKKQPQIEFAWVEGKLGGLPLKVKYSGSAGKDHVEGSADVKIFEPDVKMKITPSSHITVGPGTVGACSLYLGLLASTGARPSGEPGIEIAATITMPSEFAGEAYRVGYAQLIKESHWYQLKGLYNYVKGFQTYDWHMTENTEWCLDTSYPYHNDWRSDMNDTPGVELNDQVYQSDVINSFETTLLFIPSQNPYGDPRCVTVPLWKITWNWSAAVERGKEVTYACDAKVFVQRRAVPASYQDQHTYQYPEWKCNVKDNPDLTISDDSKWDEVRPKRYPAKKPPKK